MADTVRGAMPVRGSGRREMTAVLYGPVANDMTEVLTSERRREGRADD